MANKRVVDLIYIEQKITEQDLINSYAKEINRWSEILKKLQEGCFKKNFDSSSSDVQEVVQMRRFINQFLSKRFELIQKTPVDRRLKFLQVLPPFHLKNGIKNFLLHFYQVREGDEKNTLKFSFKSNVEKEIGILLDMYKLRKTIDTINTLQKQIQSDHSFPSILDHETQKKGLASLKECYKILFQRCIQREYQKELYNTISHQHISPKEILKRQEKNISYIFPHLLEKYDYRLQFFLIYFSTGMRAKINGKVREYHFNFLEFELLKQEFLVHWIHQKLKNNPVKTAIYSKYMIGENSLKDLVEKHPEKEIKYLQALPTDVFNDISADLNEKVADEFKSGVAVESEKHGDFAKFMNQFSKAKELVSESMDKLKAFVKRDSGSNKEKTPTQQEEKPLEKPKEKIVEEPAPTLPIPKDKIIVQLLKKNEIDFPYFMRVTTKYQQKLTLVRVKTGRLFHDLSSTVTKLLSRISESAIVKRRTPKHEWSLPYLITVTKKGETIKHLLVLGGEAKTKQLGMGYRANTGPQYSFTPFFVYASNLENSDLGTVVDNRKIRGENFYQYEFSHPGVVKLLGEYLTMVHKKEGI